MTKHKGSKKKRSVKKRVQKIKELTAEDLLLNPALLQSPQFKALPLERQFQLTSQLKQLRMMSRGGLGAPVSSSPASGDSGLYHTLMNLLNKNTRAETANAQLQAQVNAEQDRSKQLYETNKQIRKQESENEKQLKKQEKLDKANERLVKVQQQAVKTDADIIGDQIRELESKTNAKRLAATQQILAKKTAQLNRLHQLTGTKPKTPIIPKVVLTEGQERMFSEQIREQKDESLNEQSTLAQQAEALNKNGETAKSEKVEREVFQTPRKYNYIEKKFGLDDDIDHDSLPPTPDQTPYPNPHVIKFFDSDYSSTPSPEKKTEGSSINYEELPIQELEQLAAKDYDLLSPTEVQAIQNEEELDFKIKNLEEEIAQLETLREKQKYNQQRYERAELDFKTEPPNTPTSKWMLENSKSFILDELDKFANSVPYPDEQYRKTLTERIKNTNSQADLGAISAKIKADKTYQETAVKQQKVVQDAKDNMLKKLNSGKTSYGFTNDVWKAKINQALTLNQVRDLQNMMKIALHANKILNDKNNTDKALKQSATNDMVKVQKYLHEVLPVEKDIVLIDSEKVKGLSPTTQKLAPSKEYKFIDVRNYEFDPTHDSLPNDILLDGVNISNLAQRFGASSQKGRFFANIAWKLAKLATSSTVKLTFHLVKYGGKFAIAAVQNPKIATALMAGGGLMFLAKKLWNGKPTSEQVEEILTKADKDLIINLTDEELHKHIDNQIDEHIKNDEEVPQKEVEKYQESILYHQEQEKSKERGRMFNKAKRMFKKSKQSQTPSAEQDKRKLYSDDL